MSDPRSDETSTLTVGPGTPIRAPPLLITVATFFRITLPGFLPRGGSPCLYHDAVFRLSQAFPHRVLEMLRQSQRKGSLEVAGSWMKR
jgi:hypothetical protein